MAVKLRDAPLTAPVLLSAELFTELLLSSSSSSSSPPLLTIKMSRNRNQDDLNTCWFKWRPFVSLRSGVGGFKEQTEQSCWPVLPNSPGFYPHFHKEGAEPPVCVACLCAHIYERADEKCPRPCNTTWLVINKSVKWQERFLYASFRLWNAAMIQFKVCVCWCVCVYTSLALSGIIIHWPREAKWLNYNQSGLINL